MKTGEKSNRFEELIPSKRTRLSPADPEKDLLNRQLRLCVPDVVLEAEAQVDALVLDRIGQVLKKEGREVAGQAVRHMITSLAHPVIYPEVGNQVPIGESDLLVTTPLDKAREHVGEAEDLINYYYETGDVGYYYRLFNPWGAPKTLGIGSKLFYVDQRAVRGFAVVTDLEVNPDDNHLVSKMDANTWKWIDPIPCDYGQVKPPQGYAYARKHRYLKDVPEVEIVGSWLDPMPKK